MAKNVKMSDEQFTAFEQFLNNPTLVPTSTPVPVPVPASAVTAPNGDEYIRVSELPTLFGPILQKFAVTTAQVPLAINAFAEDYNRMVEDPTKHVDPAKVASEWAMSGQADFNTFVQEKYSVATVEQEFNTRNFEAAVTERANQIVAARAASGGIGTTASAFSVTNPLFAAISGRPTGVPSQPANAQQTQQSNSNSQPANGGQQQQQQQQQQNMNDGNESRPARPNSVAAEEGVMAAAAKLAAGTYADKQFDPTRQMA